jgi:hypothetical protein
MEAHPKIDIQMAPSPNLIRNCHLNPTYCQKVYLSRLVSIGSNLVILVQVFEETILRSSKHFD